MLHAICRLFIDNTQAAFSLFSVSYPRRVRRLSLRTPSELRRNKLTSAFPWSTGKLTWHSISCLCQFVANIACCLIDLSAIVRIEMLRVVSCAFTIAAGLGPRKLLRAIDRGCSRTIGGTCCSVGVSICLRVWTQYLSSFLSSAPLPEVTLSASVRPSYLGCMCSCCAYLCRGRGRDDRHSRAGASLGRSVNYPLFLRRSCGGQHAQHSLKSNPRRINSLHVCICRSGCRSRVLS